MGHLATGGIKNLLLHMPRYIKELRQQKPFCALNAVSFEIRKGECFGIIGRNGSGKSTTLGLIAGVLKPTSGQVTVRGHTSPLLELGAGFHPQLSGRENIILNGILLGMTRDRVMSRMEDIIEFSGVRAFIERPIRVYSSGMVARLGFSVAIHLDPEILLIDEVLAVGDEEFQKKCLAKMEEFRANGTTMVFVSHNLHSIASICDRVALLDRGHLVAVGAPQTIIGDYEKGI
jgi:lipopolysaccharide transport system ATP-binding protein